MMRKSEKTRAKILDTALARFRKQGFEGTTMRDVAKVAGVALGAAYYYFPSKDALVMAYYERIQDDHLARARVAFAEQKTFRERLRAALHIKLDLIVKDRKLLGAVFRTVGDPDHPLSTFGPATAPIRKASIAVFDEAIGTEPLPPDLRKLAPTALWMLHLGVLLFFIHDRSRGQVRTRALVDGLADIVGDALGLLALPGLGPVRAQIGALLALVRDAGGRPEDSGSEKEE
jgi:AcrR family transcriptional regulator